MYTFVSGNLALDFAGTVHARRTESRERLLTPADLAHWLVEAELLDADPDGDETALRRAIALREAIYRLATAARLERPFDPDDRALLNEFASGAPPMVALTADATVRRTGPVDAALAAIARAGIELLGGPDRARLKECEHTECTRLYVDTSRAGARRWCDMTRCGNRMKSAAFRARRAR
ncbi:ABATE domain-containing protein [Nocardia sp. CDC159]|uniref:ABATE domain-containing protein n=1 Tax=Nocardia pulmonis TaxID=2951408 RepID=A0A9X2J0Y6_9NOCA|nr:MULTISPECIES: ABATE domain-containing protein [Nocardia]MCM6777535.1 ABATE domain-containing protein [Nocardia pulmonis]MCM6790358.1 ABATE domain-containing protein [Nocardia sp. CDC159]